MDRRNVMPAPVEEAVFNVTQPIGTIPGLYSDGTHASDNTTNLNAMVAKLLSTGGPTNGRGGTLEFPSAAATTFAFDGGITIGKDDSGDIQPFSIILRGDGEQSRQYPLVQQQDSTADFFTVHNNPGTPDPYGDDQIGGIIFQDMVISFAYTEGQTGGGRGIVVQSGSNVRIQRVVLDEVPDAAIDFPDTLHCSVIDCDIRTQKVSTGTGIRLGDPTANTSAIETYVAGTTFETYSSPTSGAAVQIYGAEHLRMVNTRLEGWINAIVIEIGAGNGNAEHLYFGNVSGLSSGAAVTLAVSGGTSAHPTYIVEVWFAECEFEPAGGSTNYTGGGIVVGATDTYDVIDQIRFIDSYSCLWYGPGMDVQGGTNIEIMGGYYSCNGNTGGGEPAKSYSKSGIAISGPASGVRISNAACNNSVYNIYLSPTAFASATQSYGIYVGGGASSVRAQGCDLTGNEVSGLWVDGSNGEPLDVFVKHCDITDVPTPVTVTTPVSNVQVVDCPGYSDQAQILLSPPTAPPIGAFQNTTFGYYGPITVYFWGAGVTGIQIKTTTINLTSGTFNLPCNVSGEILTSGGVVEAVIVGM